MKKCVTFISVFLFISLYFGTTNVFAEPASKTLKQGIYNARNAGLLIVHQLI